MKLGFTIDYRPSRLTVYALSKLSPDIMAGRRLSSGSASPATQPDVWWLATRKYENIKLYVFKIYKFHRNGSNGVQKEWIIVTLKSETHLAKQNNFLDNVPTPSQYQKNNNAISLVYRDLFFSQRELEKAVEGLMEYSKQN